MKKSILNELKASLHKMPVEICTKEAKAGGYFVKTERKEMIIAKIANLTSLPKKDKLAQEVLTENFSKKMIRSTSAKRSCFTRKESN